MLDPHDDWRAIADRVRDYPSCANCGHPYGNASFGASHYCDPPDRPYRPMDEEMSERFKGRIAELVEEWGDPPHFAAWAVVYRQALSDVTPA